MSPIFIRQFRGKNPCYVCDEKVAKGKTLCPNHLLIARLAWRVWSAERRVAGLCISCKRRATPGNLRCRIHRKVNMAKCQKWYWIHKAEVIQNDLIRKEGYISQNLCICSEHNPLTPGARRCPTCQEYNRAKEKDDHAVLDQIRQRRRLKRVTRGLTMGQEARIQLQSLAAQ